MPAQAADSAVDPFLGRTIAGSYLVLELSGVGAMGKVYRAEQTALNRCIALKVIHPELALRPEFVDLFYGEARAASRLNHPNSVSVIDFGRTEDGIVYLAMEFLQGETLSALTQGERSLPLARCCDVLVDVLAALGEAHAHGVVHRDLKPENVIIERLRSGSDLVKVLDFGIAAIMASEGGPSEPAMVCGTPEYMSPEQGRGEAVDGRADIYAAGAMLFELLTGRVPYATAAYTLRHDQDAPVPNPATVAPQRHIPDELAAIVMRALQRRPDDRYQTALEMADALRSAARSLGAEAGSMQCPGCSQRVVLTGAFCSECGTQLPATSAAPALRASTARARLPLGELPLRGRAQALAQIEALRRGHHGAVGPALVNVFGEGGVGKTRFLRELVEQGRHAGDLVLVASAHDSAVHVPYWPIRMFFAEIAALLGLSPADLERQVGARDVLAAAGFSEAREPTGVCGMPGRARVGAVAHALSRALLLAMTSSGRTATRALLVLDDVQTCGALSAKVIAECASRLERTNALLVAASEAPHPTLLARGAVLIPLEGLGSKDARTLLEMGSTSSAARPDLSAHDRDDGRGDADDAPQWLPLYLEQLRHLGLTMNHTQPLRLAEAIDRRIQRSSAEARHLLQAACVLGRRCARATWLRLVDLHDREGEEELRVSGLVVERDGTIEVAHPLIRELVEAAIPAEVRRMLHARALELLTEADLPLEVRAEHAYRAAEPRRAIELMERVAASAAARGDHAAAVVAYQRATQLLRRVAAESPDETAPHLQIRLQLGLADALVAQGDLTNAEGLLREAVQWCGLRSLEHAQLLIALARIAGKRRRARDGYNLLGEALLIASALGEATCQAAAHECMALLRGAEGAHEGALAAWSAAHALLTDAGAAPERLAQVTLSLATARLDSGDTAGAAQLSSECEALADRAGSKSLAAQARVLRAQLAERRGQRSAAAEHYEVAVALASAAGDVAVLAQVRRRRSFPPR